MRIISEYYIAAGNFVRIGEKRNVPNKVIHIISKMLGDERSLQSVSSILVIRVVIGNVQKKKKKIIFFFLNFEKKKKKKKNKRSILQTSELAGFQYRRWKVGETRVGQLY